MAVDLYSACPCGSGKNSNGAVPPFGAQLKRLMNPFRKVRWKAQSPR